MIPRQLQLRNFMCYRADVPPLSFEGIAIACLSGENGAGKSALLDAITWALWGEARLRSDDDLIALGETEMAVDLTFALDGQEYRVVRQRSKGRRGQSILDFQVRADQGWRVLTGGTLRETQQRIEQILRMGFETFSNSAFLRQGRADEFTRKEPSKRKQVLADILGLKIYEDLEACSKSRSKDLDSSIRGVDGEITAYRTQAEKRAIYLFEVQKAEQRAAETDHARLDAEQLLHEASERYQQIEARKPLRDERRRQVEQLQQRRQDLETKLEKSNRALVAARQILQEAALIRAGAAELEAAKAEQERLEAQRDHYDLLLEQQRQYTQAILAERTRLEKELARVETDLANLHAQAARRPRIEQELRDLASQLEQFAAVAPDLEQARRRRSDLQERNRQANNLRLAQRDLQAQIDKRRATLESQRDELRRRIKQSSDQIRDEARWRSDLEQAQREYERIQQEQQRAESLLLEERQAGEQLVRLRSELENVRTIGKQIGEKLEMLRGDVATCPLCGSELGHDGLAHVQEEYERERSSLRGRYSELDKQIKTISGQQHDLKVLGEQARTKIVGANEVIARIARLERDLKAADDVRQRQQEDQRQLDDLQLQLVKGDFEQGLRAELGRIEAELAALGTPETIDTEVKRVERRIAELEQQINQQANLNAQIQRRRDEIRQIEANDPAIHEQELRQRDLTTTLHMEDFAHAERLALRQSEASIAALGYSPEANATARREVERLAEWAKKLTRLEAAEAWLAENEPLITADEQQLRDLIRDIGTAEEELRALEIELRSLDLAARTRSEAQVRLREAQTAHRVAEKDLAEKQTLLNQAEDATARLLERESERRRMADRKGLFDELAQAFGKKGVQALLIETAIPEIEREANTLLGGMTDNQMHLRFETQAETKKGDVTETLDIKIADALGTRDYDAYSGGESFRVDFAIRVALAKLLARRAGARLETLVIDEGFGSQDARGRERLVEAITSIQRDFKQILVVTHIQELKDMFPVQIEIVKTPEGSRWSIA
ncbi:MAG: SMC family ATPase [Roseiflexaceae bacterium]